MVSSGSQSVVGPGALEGLFRLWIGRLAHPAEGGEFIRPAPSHGRHEVRVRMAHEVFEWRGFAVSSPMNRRGTKGDKMVAPAASFSGSNETRRDSRSPANRLPTWSWFCEKTTKCSGGMPREDEPCRMRRYREYSPE